jgi:copper chaperone CopZ
LESQYNTSPMLQGFRNNDAFYSVLYSMKYIIVCLSITTLLMGCASKAENTPSAAVTATISLPTAKCGMCKKTIKNAVIEKAGASTIVFANDPPKMTATVSFDPATTSQEKICKAIAESGYNANDIPRDSAAYENLHSCCK